MILSCPACRIRYRVDEKALRGPAGRTVRCANCGHTWHQSAPSELFVNQEAAGPENRIEPALEVPPRPGASPRSISGAPQIQRPMPQPPSGRQRRRWTAIRWFLLALLFAAAILAVVVAVRVTVPAFV